MYVLRSALLLCLLAGCYKQPAIPRDRPLSCASDDPAECPDGFVCVDDRICAPQECEMNEECPQDLVCGGRAGCVTPGSLSEADGGSDAGSDLGGGS